MIRDGNGAMRHCLHKVTLKGLYRMLEDFIADMTLDEYKAIEQELTAVKTAIHQRMNENE